MLLCVCSSRGDEDEDDVVTDQSRGLSVAVATQAAWSPLTEDQMEHICQEANKVVEWLRRGYVVTDATAEREQFLQDDDAKLGLFGQPRRPHRIVQSERSSFTGDVSSAGKTNSSVNRRLSSAGPAPSSRPANQSGPANQSRPRRSTVYAAAEPSAAARRRSLPLQARKPPEDSTPLKRGEATPLRPTPARRPAPITGPASARRRSALKAPAPPMPRAGRHGDGKRRR